MDREFEERYWANRTIRPHTAVLLDVSDTAGKAHADSMTEAHLAWVEVDAQVDRARRKEQRARQQERNLRAGLPPGKQAQQTSWKEQKLADDERLAISRRLATRLEQQQNRASYLADGVLLLKQKAEIAPPARHPIILAEGHTGRPAIKDQAAAASSANQGAKHLPVQEQEQSNLKQGSGLVLGASARAESVRSCSSTATQSARKYSIGLSSFREAAETINSALEAAISSFNTFREQEAPKPLGQRVPSSAAARTMAFAPSSLASSHEKDIRESHDRRNFGGLLQPPVVDGDDACSITVPRVAAMVAGRGKRKSANARRLACLTAGNQAANAAIASHPRRAWEAGMCSAKGSAPVTAPTAPLADMGAPGDAPTIADAPPSVVGGAAANNNDAHGIQSCGGDSTNYCSPALAAAIPTESTRKARRPPIPMSRPRLSDTTRNPNMSPDLLISPCTASGFTRFDRAIAEHHAFHDTQSSYTTRFDSNPRWKKPVGRTYRAPDRAPQHLVAHNLLTHQQQSYYESRDPRVRVRIHEGAIMLERPDWSPSQLPEPWA